MKFTGLHHITMITGDAQANVRFYGDLLGLRLVKKTVNFDQPDAYHLYFGDDAGNAGSILTWFEFPGARRGRAGAGAIHTLQLAVGSEESLDFWQQRLADYDPRREAGTLRFHDYDGLQLELVVASLGNAPLTSEHPEIPAEHAIGGVEGARAYAIFDGVEDPVLTKLLGFTYAGNGEYELEGSDRRFRWGYDAPPAGHHIEGAGSVHHIAWASADADHLDWQARVMEAGGLVTDVRDRDYFRSIYFRERSGVLFEIATLSPGFAVDEDPDHLGEALRLPKQHEHLRGQLEARLTPIPATLAQTARAEARGVQA